MTQKRAKRKANEGGPGLREMHTRMEPTVAGRGEEGFSREKELTLLTA